MTNHSYHFNLILDYKFREFWRILPLSKFVDCWLNSLGKLASLSVEQEAIAISEEAINKTFFII